MLHALVTGAAACGCLVVAALMIKVLPLLVFGSGVFKLGHGSVRALSQDLLFPIACWVSA